MIHANPLLVNEVVATVPTVYGIETYTCCTHSIQFCFVATVPTVYGIETKREELLEQWDQSLLQQYLPFTVLKLPRY